MTGGAGFIGSHLVEELVRRGRTVRVLDNFSTGRHENLNRALASGRVEVIEGDVADDACLRQALQGCSGVFHLAAAVGVGTVTRDPLASLENNLDGVRSLFRAVSERAESPRVIYFSSSEVYGKSEDRALSESQPFVIGPSAASRWSYAAAKIVGEYLALGAAETHGVPITVVRCFNTAGPRQLATYGMVIPRFFDQALAGAPLTVYGDGTQTRCFSYVGDVVHCVLRLFESPGTVGEVFNVGSDEEISILDLAERIRGLVGSGSRIGFVPFEEAYGPGFEESTHRVPDLRKLESTIGERPRTSLDRILATYLESLRPGPRSRRPEATLPLPGTAPAR